jgi:hypothetical protein
MTTSNRKCDLEKGKWHESERYQSIREFAQPMNIG